jgi:hypothetical protein
MLLTISSRPPGKLFPAGISPASRLRRVGRVGCGPGSFAGTAEVRKHALALVARQKRRARFSVCGYLVDTFCLGVKNTIGPEAFDGDSLRSFRATYFTIFDSPGLAAPLDLVQHLVFGAVDYARSLGFEPHRDFRQVAGHLGAWEGPSAITFGDNGRPSYVQGPSDDPARIIRTLERTAGAGNFGFLAEVS